MATNEHTHGEEPPIPGLKRSTVELDGVLATVSDLLRYMDTHGPDDSSGPVSALAHLVSDAQDKLHLIQDVVDKLEA